MTRTRIITLLATLGAVAALALTVAGISGAAGGADSARQGRTPGAAPDTAPAGNLIVQSPATLASDGADVFATDFGWIGPDTGSALIADARSGRRIEAGPTTNGQISTAIADGSGGWYVGGDFSDVHGVSQRFLAGLNRDATIDLTFHPTIDGFVSSLIRSGHDLFVAGFFSHVDGRAQSGVAELDARTGRLVAAFRPSGLPHISELALGPGYIYAGLYDGYYRHGRSQTAYGLLKLDRRTGRRVPGFAPRLAGPVKALAIGDGSVYVGTSDGAGRLQALDPRTGVPRAGFRPKTGGAVQFLAATGGRLLVAGTLESLHGAIAVDPRTGAQDTAFVCHFHGTVNSVTSAGGRLWLGGTAYRTGPPQLTGRVTPVNAKTCAADGRVIRPAGPVNAVAGSAGRVLVGGAFATGEAIVGDLATLSARSGRLIRLVHSRAIERAEHVNSPDAVAAAGGRVWLWFPGELLGDDPGTGRAAVTRYHRGAPIVSLTAADGLLYAVTDSGKVQVFSARTGRTHRFRVPLRGKTATLAAGDGALYLAGSYKRTRRDGQQANIAVLRVDPRTGRLDRAFDPHVNGPVQSVAVTSHAVYLDGYFFYANHLRRTGLSAAAPRTGDVIRRFDPTPPGQGRTRTYGSTIQVVGNRLLYLQGDGFGFDCFDAPQRAYDLRTGHGVPAGVTGVTIPYFAIVAGGKLFGTSCSNTFSSFQGAEGAVASLGIAPGGR